MSGHASDSDKCVEDKFQSNKMPSVNSDTESNKRLCPDQPRKRPQSIDIIYSVPLEIWVKIFTYVLRTEPAVPFLYRIASVLPVWQYLAPFLLFQKVDLSASHMEETQKWLSSNKVSQCREINLRSFSFQVIKRAVTALRDNCPDLEVVHLSDCARQSNRNTLKILADGCQRIRHLDISFSQAKCSQLEVLDLRGSTVQGLNVDMLQQHCPALKVLLLSDAIVVDTHDTVHPQGAGFLHLKELSCAYSRRRASIEESVLVRLLHNASGLTLLDLRGCVYINPWVSICPRGRPSPITGLKELYLGRSSIAIYCEWLTAALQQWGHSLTVLDLSGILPPAHKLEEAFSSLRHVPHCPLSQLDLSGSSVTPSCVLTILATFHDLKCLDLTSCRSIPRALQGLHVGSSGLTLLWARLSRH